MPKQPPFVHLHLHTQYSILDGAISIPNLMKRVVAQGMPAVAMTDHGNLFGAVEFHEAAVQAGVRPILGCEVYVAQGSRFDRDPETGGFNGINHLILLAMNDTGYWNLVQLVSKGYLEGFYYKPRIDLELLKAHSEGLIATSGCLSGMVPSSILKGRTREAWEVVETYQRVFPDRYYLELQRHGLEEQDLVNRELLRMHEDLNLPLIATNDCHYLEGEDAHSHEALLCVQTGKTLSDPSRFRFNGSGFYVKTAAEMLEVFADVPDALRNTVELAERCDFVLETGKLQLPEFQLPAGETLETYLEGLVSSGLRQRMGAAPSAPYEERLRFELDIIERCGYEGYFLIVWDLIRFARERGVPVGPGRGSSAGSLVAYALRIVDIDPIEYDIPFERFLNPERVSMPDIDVDFCMNRRAEVIRYVEERYNGEGDEGRRVSGIVTFGTMQARAALRDVGRVLGIPFADVDRIAKLVPNALGISLDDSLRQSRELRQAIEQDERNREMFELARALEGQIRNSGKHAAGVVISSRPLLETAPLYRDPKTGEIVTQFDYRSSEKIGLVKFDLLGLRTLTIIADTVRRVRASHDPGFEIASAPLDDRATYDQLCRGDTEGVFQVGQSTGITDLVVKIAPRSFRDLIPLVGLYRPGPLKSGMVEDFVERRHGRAHVEYLVPELEEILADTYGVIIYQDQVMQIANRLASYSLGEGDLLRRAMGKKNSQEMEHQRTRFVEGCIQNGHARQDAEQIFNLMNQFAGYGFPKAHAAAYALLTHQTAYLKAHYPAEYVAATMTAEWREHDKLERYIRDAAARGLTMLPPSVNESDADFAVTGGGKGLRFGLRAIKNVGEGAVEAILEARAAGGPFETLFEFAERVDSRRVNRRVMESLIRCGSFDFSKATRASLFKVLPSVIDRAQKSQRDRDSGQASLFGGETALPEPPLPEVHEWPIAERLAAEKEMLGFYVTGHPLTAHAETLERFTTVRPGAVSDENRGREVRMGGILTSLTTTRTRKGKVMARASLEDADGRIDVVFFPDAFDQHAPLLREGGALLLTGTLQAESERPELIARDALRLEDAYQRWTRELHVRVRTDNIDEECLERGRAVLDLAPGNTAVLLRLLLPTGARACLDLPRHRVTVTGKLVRELEGVFGKGSVECRV
ncbi:MAG: DNA polymerase III subunit alpha [Myxococcota bacterium]